MKKLISKEKMEDRAINAAMMAPSINDRLRHATEMAEFHPINEPNLKPKIVSQISDTNTSSKGQFEIVSIDRITENPFNARKIYRPERVSELASSIAANGQEIPGIATIRNGQYILVAGHYRLRALKILGITTMTLMVYGELSDRELYAHSYRENAEREGQSGLDNALSWKELLTQKIYSSETEIAEATGISLPNVNKTLAVLRLSSLVLDVIKENPTSYPFSVLYDLVLYESLAGPAKTILMARQIAAGEISRRDLQAARAKIDSSKQRKRKETSRQYKIQVDGHQIGFLKEWDSGKVMFEVLMSDTKERSSLLAELRSKFKLTE